jgi:hypothetical protein
MSALLCFIVMCNVIPSSQCNDDEEEDEEYDEEYDEEEEEEEDAE